jgi:hypothetical protein
MTAGIWLLFYDIAAVDRDHYVDWFHRYHIPEKLARPGYRWAAHFEASSPSANSDFYGYTGMFGGDSTRVFLDPSPAQLKLTQSDDTRAMMALRHNSSSAILANEWSWQAPADTNAYSVTFASDAAMSAPHIQILTVEARGHYEIVSSLCAQKLASEFATKRAAIACHKMINVTGGPRHVMLFEVTGVSPAGAGSDQPVAPVDLSPLTDLGDAVQMRTRYGQRIWPA